MSGGAACKCSERQEPISAPEGSNRPGRLWRVIDYKCNHSAFNGYHRTYSAYSSIACLRCGARWRTNSSYADSLPAYQETDINFYPGCDGYEAQMEAWDRTPFKR